jgi:antitoxin CptB
MDLADVRLKRLRMRSWHRGTKEMDLILGRFADARLATLQASDLDAFERVLTENDQDLICWVSRRTPTPGEHDAIIDTIRTFHGLA